MCAALMEGGDSRSWRCFPPVKSEACMQAVVKYGVWLRPLG